MTMLDENKGEGLVGADDLSPMGGIDQLRASIADYGRVDALVKMGSVVDKAVGDAISGTRFNINVAKLPDGFGPADSIGELQPDPTAEDIYADLFGPEGPDQHSSI